MSDEVFDDRSSYIDRADWHYLGEGFPEGCSNENGATHIGMYMAWIITNGLIGEYHLQESENALESLERREITGRDFLISECDMKFAEEDVNDEGSTFTRFYYTGIGPGGSLFLYDYAEMFIKQPMTFYDVKDSWENYDQIKPVIDERFRSWKAVRKIYDEKEYK